MDTTTRSDRSQGRLHPAGVGAALQAAIDDVAWAANGLADELDAMIARRERGPADRDAAAQVAAAARLLPRRR